MSYTGMKAENVRQNNRSMVLRLLCDQGPMSRKDLAQALGLSSASVTYICTELLEERILCEKGEIQEIRAGRKKILVDINYDFFRVISIRIEKTETCVTITDLKGRNPVSRRMATDSGTEPEEFLKEIAGVCQALVAEARIPKEILTGVGVSVPGILGDGPEVSDVADRIWDRPVNLAACLERELHLPVVVSNDVRAFAEAELIFGSGKNLEDMLFLRGGPGVAAAIVIQKKLYDSHIYKNAEIGHIVLDPQGRPCRCGRRGCLETFVSSSAQAEKLNACCSAQEKARLGKFLGRNLQQIEEQDLPDLLRLNDPSVMSILEPEAERFARTVCNVITVLAPDRVILCGRLFESDGLLDRFLAGCRAFDPRYGDGYIARSPLWDRMDYIGPLAMVMNRLILTGQFRAGR